MRYLILILLVAGCGKIDNSTLKDILTSEAAPDPQTINATEASPAAVAPKIRPVNLDGMYKSMFALCGKVSVPTQVDRYLTIDGNRATTLQMFSGYTPCTGLRNTDVFEVEIADGVLSLTVLYTYTYPTFSSCNHPVIQNATEPKMEKYPYWMDATSLVLDTGDVCDVDGHTYLSYFAPVPR